MRHRHRGHIINLASTAGVVALPHAAGYSASKHAVVGLTEAVRREELDSGIDFSYVLPVPVRTDLMRGARGPRWTGMIEPEQVARAVIGAIRTGQVEVYVPKSARSQALLRVLAPRAFYERLGRFFRLDRIFDEVDPAARAKYQERIRRGGA
jgi:short-subunit dehydrogenase